MMKSSTVVASLLLPALCSGFTQTKQAFLSATRQLPRRSTPVALSSETDNFSSASSAAPTAPAPVLNGKRVLPYKVLSAGLTGHKIAAVYAVLSKDFKKGTAGWEETQFVGVSQNLAETLESHVNGRGAERVAHIRALSFTFPQPNAMQDVAQEWRSLAKEAGADMEDAGLWTNDVLDYLYDEEDDDEDDEDWSVEMTADASAAMSEPIVSPFESNADAVAVSEGEALPFTANNVDKVLDEVRPYLISDGGNVAVERVDEAEKTVYLKLEGACGSCASSTVTMQMGIERVLKENFPDLNQVLQVEDDPEAVATELTWESVEEEVNRLRPAVIAMGGVCELISVDSKGGVVELRYQGASKVQQGLELAIRDVPFVEDVIFVPVED